MNYFNGTFGIVIVCSLAITSGCLLKPRQSAKTQEAINSLRVNQSEEQQQSTFFVAEGRQGVSGTAVVSENIPTWMIPNRMHFSFNACLYNRAVNQPIRLQWFKIELGDGTYAREKTGPDGCLTWSEEVNFNPIAKTTYLAWDRAIIGEGVNRGRVTVPLAISPWAVFVERGEGLQPVVDMRIPTIPESYIFRDKSAFVTVLNGFSTDLGAASNQRITNLFAEDIKVQSIPLQYNQDGSADFELKINLTPQFTTEGIIGRKWPVKSNQGKYRVYAFLISESLYQGKVYREILNTAIPMDEVETRTGQIQASVRTKIKKQPFGGKIYLALRVDPIEGPMGLGPLEAMYDIGEYGNLGKTVLGMLTIVDKKVTNKTSAQSSNVINFDSFWSSIKNASNFVGNPDVADILPYHFDLVTGRFDGLVLSNSTTNIIRFRVDLCINEPSSNRRLRQQEFSVDIYDEADKFIRTVSEDSTNTKDVGCVFWNDEMEYKHYTSERLIPRKYVVKHLASNLKRDVIAYIHPWDYGWTFSRDLRSLENTDRLREPRRSLTFITGFTYNTLEFRYHIDKFLNLFVRKTVQLNFQPRVARYSSLIRGRRAVEDLQDGIYLMKIAVQKDYYDPRSGLVSISPNPKFDPSKAATAVDGAASGNVPSSILTASPDAKTLEFISVNKKLVRVQGGRVVTNAEFTMTDLRLMRIRSNLFIQLEPIDERAFALARVLSKKGMSIPKIEEIVRKLSGNISRESVTQELGASADQEVQAIFTQNRDELLALVKYDGDQVLGGDLFDYDSIIEPASRSGLDKRTFLGPIILLQNNYNASLRPTDDLEEARCDSPVCDQLEEAEMHADRLEKEGATAQERAEARAEIQKLSEQRRSELTSIHTDSLGKFANISVDDLIKRYKQLRKEFHAEQKLMSSLPLYLERSNSVFVSKSDEELTAYTETTRSNATDQSHCLDNPQSKLTVLCPEIETERAIPYKRFSQFFDNDTVSRAYSGFGLETYRNVKEIFTQWTDGVDKMVNAINYHGSSTPESIENFFDSGKVDSKATAAAVCRMLVLDEFLHTPMLDAAANKSLCPEASTLAECLKNSKAKSKDKTGRANLSLFVRSKYKQCVDDVYLASTDPKKYAQAGYFNTVDAPPLLIRHKLRVNDVNPTRAGNNSFRGGLNMNVQTAANFGYLNSESLSRNVTTKVNPIGSGMSLISKEPGFFGKFLKFITAGFNIDSAYMAGSSNSQNNSVQISSGTYLVAQMASFDIEFTNYEKCIEVRLNPDWVTRRLKYPTEKIDDLGKRIDYFRYLGIYPQPEWLEGMFTKGLFLCSGKKETKPKSFPERYYYMSQHFTVGDLLDEANILNHPWLLSMRGERDFVKFIEHIKGSHNDYVLMPKETQRKIDKLVDIPFSTNSWYITKGKQLRDMDTDAKLDSFPLQHLIDSYKYMTPGFGGLYDILGDERTLGSPFAWDSIVNELSDPELAPIVKSESGKPQQTTTHPTGR